MIKSILVYFLVQTVLYVIFTALFIFMPVQADAAGKNVQDVAKLMDFINQQIKNGVVITKNLDASTIYQWDAMAGLFSG